MSAPATPLDPSRSRLGIFMVVLGGQVVSQLGSSISRFALSLWVYQTTGSITQFGLALACEVLPVVLLAPIAGVVVDRGDRRTIMAVSDSLAALSTLGVYALMVTGRAEVWHVYLGTAVAAAANAFQSPAWLGAMAMLVPKEQLGRAMGMMELGQGSSQLAAPAIAGLLLAWFDVRICVLLEVITCAVAVGLLLTVRFPQVARARAEGPSGLASVLREALQGWRYVLTRSGLLLLMCYSSIINLTVGFARVLMPPLLLQLSSPTTLGLVTSITGAGFLAGSVGMSVWGGPRRKVNGLFGFGLLIGASLALGFIRPSVPLIALAGFLLTACLPILASCSESIWLAKVPPDIQGRVFGVRRTFAELTAPLAYLAAGPLAEHAFKPLLVEGGPLAPTLGLLLGVGPERGLTLLFLGIGLLTMLVSLAGLTLPKTRRVEEELPDWNASAG